jgi:hypothetical protein
VIAISIFHEALPSWPWPIPWMHFLVHEIFAQRNIALRKKSWSGRQFHSNLQFKFCCGKALLTAVRVYIYC